jgi:hypothetical protein
MCNTFQKTFTELGEMKRVSSGVFLNVLLMLSLVELGFKLLVLPLTERLLDKLTGLATLTARKPLGLNTSLTVRSDDNLNSLVQAAPPT